MRIALSSSVALAILLLNSQAADSAGAEHPQLVKVETAQCIVCHDDLLEGSTVHAAAEDDCTFCHKVSVQPRGTTVSLIEAEPSLCLFCHDDLEPAVELELEAPHFPVSDSCLNCHDPHSSDSQRLLAAPMTELCSDCHDLEDLNEAHGDQLTSATRCTACHRPHGSDNDNMLLASQLHPPFESGSCNGCHRPPFGSRIRLRSRGEKLCTACHGEFPQHAGGSIHGALQGERGRAGCLSCHHPHMSDFPQFLVNQEPE